MRISCLAETTMIDVSLRVSGFNCARHSLKTLVLLLS